MRWLAAGAAFLALIALGGCGLDPFEADTEPPIESAGLRITEGTGTGANYVGSVAVGRGNVVQVSATIGEGENVIITVARGPAIKLRVEYAVEGSDRALETATIESRDGDPIEIGEAFEYDPGYVGVEHLSTADAVKLRLAVPRVVDTPQGQVQFTFKVPVR